jgi:hypothetical protein
MRTANPPAPASAHPHPRRAPAQPEEPGPGHPHRRDDGGHRAQRLGQVQPGVRHAVRRGPAALRRDLQRLRAAVPRPHGPPGGRPRRRRAAGDRHRPDQPGAHLALDGRHDDRAERPPEAAVRARRAAVRPADRAAGAARHAGDHLRRPAARAPRARRPAAGLHLPGRTAGRHQRRAAGAVAVGQRLHTRAGRARGGRARRSWTWWPTASAWPAPRRCA